MVSTDYWRLFLETGAPEFYLLYNNARKMEKSYVFDNSRLGTSGYNIQ